MALPSDAFRYQLNNAGRTFRIRYYTESLGSVWDDDRTLTGSGDDLYVSGIMLSIDNTDGSEDRVLLEQGRINFNDSKFFLAGSLDLSSGVKIFTMTISGEDKVYSQITPGVNVPEYRGENVYKKVYGRFVQGGSLL